MLKIKTKTQQAKELLLGAQCSNCLFFGLSERAKFPELYGHKSITAGICFKRHKDLFDAYMAQIIGEDDGTGYCKKYKKKFHA